MLMPVFFIGLGATVAVFRFAVHAYKTCKKHYAKFYILTVQFAGQTNDSAV